MLAGCGGLGTRVVSESKGPDDHKAAGQQFGYITAVDPEARTVTFDPAEWVSRPAGDAEYAIRNPSRRARVFKIARNAEITAAYPVSAMRIPPPADWACCDSYPVTHDAFIGSFGKPNPCKCISKFWLTIRGDVAHRLDEQYTP